MSTQRRKLAAAATTTALAVAMGTAHGFDFRIGELDASFDSDIGWGLSQRTARPDSQNLGPYGNRYLFQDKWDIFTNTIKGSHTFEAKGDSYGGLLRGNWFYDFEMANQKLPDAAKNRAKQHGDITDAYVYKRFLDDQSLSVRFGKQVISWGENTFIGGAINDINTVDISKLRTPGAELKDAFTGTPAINIAYNFLENYTIEAFALFAFDEIKADPMGNFFTGLDATADGGGFPNALGGFGGSGTVNVPPGIRNRCVAPDGKPCDVLNGFLVRAGDDIPSGGGQWGIAFRVFLPNFGNGGEVALYYQNLHDHLPMLSAIRNPSGPGGRFVVEYPEDIERLGASFNTNMYGVALSGEYSWRRNAPIQLTAPLLLGAGLPVFGTLPVAPGTKVKGYDRVERHQVQFTVNKNWGVTQWLRADANTTVAEIMWGWIGGRPGDTIVSPVLGGAPNLFEPDISKDFGKLVVRHALLYNAALFNVIALEPSVAFSWDLHGFSNELGGAKLVVDDRKAVTLGLGFLYGGGKWTGGINYTNFFGPTGDVNIANSRYNGVTDRDFLSFNASYSF